MSVLTFGYLILYALFSFAQIWQDLDRDKPVWQIGVTLFALAIMCLFIMAFENQNIAHRIIDIIPHLMVAGMCFELYNLYKDQNELRRLKPAHIKPHKVLNMMSNLIPLLYICIGYGLAFWLYVPLI